MVGAVRTVRSGPSRVRSELWSDSEFGVLGRSFGSEFWVGVLGRSFGRSFGSEFWVGVLGRSSGSEFGGLHNCRLRSRHQI